MKEFLAGFLLGYILFIAPALAKADSLDEVLDDLIAFREGQKKLVIVDGKPVAISNPSKLLYPPTN